MTQATEMTAKYVNSLILIIALDTSEVKVDQEWENETTTWTFPDGSKIIANGSELRTE